MEFRTESTIICEGRNIDSAHGCSSPGRTPGAEPENESHPYKGQLNARPADGGGEECHEN